MAKYAVIRIKGRQYRVSEKDEILVDKLADKKPKIEVLLVAGEGKTQVGKPLVSGAKVSIKVVAQEEKGEKIDILKYKSKSRYRRHYGFRPQYTRLLIQKISS